MASLVTIEKSYLDTLMRRAECHIQPSSFDAPAELLTVAISKSEHDDMLRKCREYENLKRALYQGGIPHASLETLIQGSDPLQTVQPAQRNHNDHYGIGNGPPYNAPLVDRDISRPATTTTDNENTAGNGWQTRWAEKGERPPVDGLSGHGSAETDDTSIPSDDKGHSPMPGDGNGSGKQQATTGENRTVVLKNLPERATHRDVVAAVRGGALVDVFLRSRERTASVTFADAKAASDYFAHAKRRDVYILGKPVDAAWSERQFHFPPYMATQLSNGASRNLVIRGVHPNLTDARIRADLEHIHNLIVISITYAQGNAYISTNSVQKASFARTCMKSRIPYNSMRIEYSPDECVEPLPKIPTLPRREPSQPTTNKLNPMANRFQMLNLDGAEDDSDEKEEMASCTSGGGGISWANTSIAV